MVKLWSNTQHLFKMKPLCESFWYHVKGLCSLTSEMSFSRSHATIVDE